MPCYQDGGTFLTGMVQSQSGPLNITYTNRSAMMFDFTSK